MIEQIESIIVGDSDISKLFREQRDKINEIIEHLNKDSSPEK